MPSAALRLPWEQGYACAVLQGPYQAALNPHYSERVLEEQERPLRRIFGKLANHENVVDKGAFLGFCRKCALSPQLLSRAEMMEIYKTTQFDESERMRNSETKAIDRAGAKGDCLTFYGWLEALRRSAGVLFSGDKWDELYPTGKYFLPLSLSH